MGFVDDIIAEDFLYYGDSDLSIGGESVTYTKFDGTTATATTINVNVFRGIPAVAEDGTNMISTIEVFIANDSTKGVTSVEVGIDTITIAEKYNGTARARTVRDIIDQDAGGFLVSLY